jgi:hypothetical protein
MRSVQICCQDGRIEVLVGGSVPEGGELFFQAVGSVTDLHVLTACVVDSAYDGVDALDHELFACAVLVFEALRVATDRDDGALFVLVPA